VKVEFLAEKPLQAIRQAVRETEAGRVWATRIVGLGLFCVAAALLYCGARLGMLLEQERRK
jgi:hypothetical protein